MTTKSRKSECFSSGQVLAVRKNMRVAAGAGRKLYGHHIAVTTLVQSAHLPNTVSTSPQQWHTGTEADPVVLVTDLVDPPRLDATFMRWAGNPKLVYCLPDLEAKNNDPRHEALQAMGEVGAWPGSHSVYRARGAPHVVMLLFL
jgi:hypothetical protein